MTKKSPFNSMQVGEHEYQVVPYDPSAGHPIGYEGMYGLCSEEAGGIVGWFHDEEIAIQICCVLNSVWMSAYHYNELIKTLAF